MLKEDLVKELMYFMVEFEGKVSRPAQLCAKNTVSGVQLQLLLFLQHYGPQKMSVLAGYRKISKPQLTTAINGLVKQNLVIRESDEEDRRIIKIRCTEAGLQYLENLSEQLIAYLSHSVDGLSEAEQKELLSSLHTSGRLIHKFKTAADYGQTPEYKEYT